MPRLYDMHSHLDFVPNSKELACEACERGIASVVSTVIPSSFVSAREKLKDNENIHVALGIHPWWVANNRVGENEINSFIRLLPTTNVIGEIGLDIARTNRASASEQSVVLRRVLEAMRESGRDRLVYFHAVKSAGLVMDMIEELGMQGMNTYIFHWFSSNHEDFGRAISLGFHFSVGLKMLASKNGEAYAKAIPDGFLLLETDNPPRDGMEWSAEVWEQEIVNTTKALAEIRGTSEDTMHGLLNMNAEALIDEYFG